MRGSALDVLVTTPSPASYYDGPTVPPFIKDINVHTPDSSKLTKYVDVSAVIADQQGTKEIRIAIVNRSATEEFEIPILFGPNATVSGNFTIHEVWHEDLKASNTFGKEKVATVVKQAKFSGTYKLKRHSFQG